MKKTLALILAIVMALGCMSITAFAADNEATISAEITAADFSYTMVIPTSTTLTEAKHENVLLGTTAAADGDGIVSIKDIKHPTDKVNVYYTVDLTKGNLTDGTTTIAATYKYKQGENAFAAIDGTTKVTVYANKTVTNSLVNVTADDTQWKAAPTGTYNATVTFNFEKEDALIKINDPQVSSDTYDKQEHLWYNEEYTDVEHLDVIEGTEKARNAGQYSVTVKPKEGYCWEDGTQEERTEYWEISKYGLWITAPERFDGTVADWNGWGKARIEESLDECPCGGEFDGDEVYLVGEMTHGVPDPAEPGIYSLYGDNLRLEGEDAGNYEIVLQNFDDCINIWEDAE